MTIFNGCLFAGFVFMLNWISAHRKAFCDWGKKLVLRFLYRQFFMCGFAFIEGRSFSFALDLLGAVEKV